MVDAKQTCPLHSSILPALSSILEQHDPISSIPVRSGSALDVMCALFLPQWSELKACEKPIQFSSPCWTPPCPHRLGVSPLSVAENEGCLAVPDAVADAEGGASCGGGQDGEITMPFDCFNACPFIREENGKEQSVAIDRRR